MKVICIDASNFKWNYPLVEGNIYDALQSPTYKDGYIIVGYEFSIRGGRANYKKFRFIPLSEIDETEMIREKLQRK